MARKIRTPEQIEATKQSIKKRAEKKSNMLEFIQQWDDELITTVELRDKLIHQLPENDCQDLQLLNWDKLPEES